MTAAQVDAYVREVERRWRERTPARDVGDVLPETRVGRSEMRAWALEQWGLELTIDDVFALEAPLAALFARLRREFPTERWERRPRRTS